MNPEGDKKVKEIILEYSNILLKPEDVDKVIKRAYVRTTTDTHQSMEAVVHNLNSMHCLPGSEKIWVYDTKTGVFGLMRMDEINNKFELNRFKVLQINKGSGETEFKYITASKVMGKNRNICTVKDRAGHTIRVTDNHRIMDLDDEANIVENYPSNVKYMLSPRGIDFPVINNDICLESYGRIRKDSPYLENHIAITPEFAELMGYYIADGCILGKDGSTKTMCITACEKVSHEHLVELATSVFGDKISVSKTFYNNSKTGTAVKDSRFYLGSRLSKMIIDKFGRVGDEKKIPKEILFSNPEIRQAFLRAYFVCDGRSGRKYSESCSINKDLRDSLQLMIMSLSGYCYTSEREVESPFNGKNVVLHQINISNKESKRIGLKVSGDTSFEIPKYSLQTVGKVLGIFTGKVRKNDEVRYSEIEDCYDNGLTSAKKYLNFFTTPVESIETNVTEECVYDISVEDNENFLTSSCIFVHNSRAGRTKACPKCGKPYVMAV